MKLLARRVDVDADLARLEPGLDTMVHSVLEQRLEQQWRHERIVRHLVDAPRDLETISQAQLLDLQVLPAELDFTRERRKIPSLAHDDAEKLGEVAQHRFRPPRVLPYQGQHRVDAVEEEMRAYACLQ